MRKPYDDVTSILQFFPGSGNTCTNLRTIPEPQFIAKRTLFVGFRRSKPPSNLTVNQAASRSGGLMLEHGVVEHRGAFRFGKDAFADHQLNQPHHGDPFRAAVMRIGLQTA
jgi:hypothetical protein